MAVMCINFSDCQGWVTPAKRGRSSRFCKSCQRKNLLSGNRARVARFRSLRKPAVPTAGPVHKTELIEHGTQDSPVTNLDSRLVESNDQVAAPEVSATPGSVFDELRMLQAKQTEDYKKYLETAVQK